MATTSTQRIRIKLQAFDHEVVDLSAKRIVDTVLRSGARVSGPVPLPTQREIYCVITSPHKDKDAREHFEMRTHRRLIDVVDPTPRTIEDLTRLELPAGVGIEIKLPGVAGGVRGATPRSGGGVRGVAPRAGK